MKTRNVLTPVLAAAGILLSAGCASFQSRSEEKSYVFESLSPETQQRLKEGEIKIGDTQDMVYIALGEPSDKRLTVTHEGSNSTWIYATYDSHFDGETFVGYQRVITRRGLLGSYHIEYVPVTESSYHDHADERFRVTFNNGRVSRIDSSS